jgi:predicted phosphate transport protein (TIGR00153 family)
VAILFKITRTLEAQIDEFLNCVSQGSLIFSEAVSSYLNNAKPHFEECMLMIDSQETKADDLRRAIENNLYSHSLIPEHRGDVLGLLESTDSIIDTINETALQFSIEKPFIPPELNATYMELTDMAVKSAEALVMAARAFFKDVKSVQDHLHKVYMYEKVADLVSSRLRRTIFEMENLDLSQKFHLRYFTENIDKVADAAEDVADRLAIYTIKRTI